MSEPQNPTVFHKGSSVSNKNVAIRRDCHAAGKGERAIGQEGVR
jgi:hypothetical protein